MAYLVNQARLASLTVNGSDYTNNFISWEVSDASAYKNGFVSTTGTVILGQIPGGFNLEDYDRDNFKRGSEVILNITYPDGTTSRHPRGLLYVISTSYEIETGQTTLEIGCRLALAAITEYIDSLLSLAPIPLDEAQETYSNIAGSFASAGKYAYQDNTGNIVTGTFFEGDSFGTSAEGTWVSILGITALKVSALSANGAIPDKIEITYSSKTGANSDEQGKQIIDVTESSYWTNYPAVVYDRILTSADIPVDSATTASSTGSISACGNTPTQPSDSLVSCSDGYTTVQTNIVQAATRTTTSTQKYDGPAAQLSYTLEEVRGPAIEANNQYYADSFAYCRQTWATACDPNGSCPLDGMDNVLLTKSETFNEFSDDGRLIKTTKEDWATVLSAAQPFNWRSGNTNGEITDFTPISVTDMYRAVATITEYVEDSDTYTETVTTTYTSAASLGSGLGDASPNISGVSRNGNVTGISSSTTAPGLPDGTINSLATTTNGSGSGLIVDATCISSGVTATISSAFDASNLVYTPSTTYWEGTVNVSTDNTSGTGMQISMKWYQEPGYYYEWAIIALLESGTGYNEGEYVRINADELIKAGATFVASGYLKIQVLTVAQGSVLLTPLNPGAGYVVGDSVVVAKQTLIDKGYIGVTKDIKATVTETIDGYTSNSSSIDAYAGIITKETRTSTTITAELINPDTLNSPQTETGENTTTAEIFTGRYVTPPNEAGLYTLKDSIPVPILLDTDAGTQAIVDGYSDYIVRFTKGNALGITIGETLRKDVATSWKPNCPFRYFDPVNQKAIAMRMDGTTWGVTSTESGFVTRGLWVGTSNGTITIPSNLTGDSRPDMGSGTTPPSAVVGISITNETVVNTGAFSWTIDVVFSTSVDVDYTIQTPYEPTMDISTYWTSAYTVSGYIVTPGSLLATDSTGSIPLDYNGSLLVQTATIIDGDVFA